ncbi:MAG: sensor histidine kinase [Vulcanimicrobiaceae bacterium]|jgi:two-component system sensor histidine kinase DesK
MVEAWRRLPISRQGWLPFLWLVYALGVPISLIGSGMSPSAVAFQLGVLGVFLVLYVVGYGRCGWTAMAYGAAIAACGLAATRLDYAALAYFISAAAFFAWGLETQNAIKVLAGYLVMLAAYAWSVHMPLALGGIIVVLAAAVGTASVAGAQQKRADVRLRQANEEIERLAKVAERERIARDLHDVLGHTLSLITIKSELAAKLAERDLPGAAEEIRAVEKIARETLGELRAAVAGYRAAGIANELAHAREVLTSAGLCVDCEADDIRLPPTHEGVLALAIRESVTNVLRHADASAVRLRLGADADRCRFEIHDDGCGGDQPEGLGLRGMRERVESYGGSLERHGEDGTQLIVTLPLVGAPT